MNQPDIVCTVPARKKLSPKSCDPPNIRKEKAAKSMHKQRGLLPPRELNLITPASPFVYARLNLAIRFVRNLLTLYFLALNNWAKISKGQ